jgi:hypothetical protein
MHDPHIQPSATFNIDDVEPTRLVERLARERRYLQLGTEAMFTLDRKQDGKPGIRLTRLFDWRYLERRAHETYLMYHDYVHAWWKILEDLAEASGKLGCKDKSVWIIAEKDTHGQNVMHVSVDKVLWQANYMDVDDR